LATALANKLGLPVYYEPVTDNAYLADFYKDIKRYGFAMQVPFAKRLSNKQQPGELTNDDWIPFIISIDLFIKRSFQATTNDYLAR
jgi:deoxyadenosine/deoxycytidine kinase